MTSLLQEKLCEIHTQAPPPSKDFHHLTVTKNEVIWKSWKITFRPRQEWTFPREVKKLHEDFILDEQLQNVWAGWRHGDRTVLKIKEKTNEQRQKATSTECPLPLPRIGYSQEQLQNIFGNKMLDYTLNLCQGHYDFLVRMPDSLIIHILSFLNTEDIRQLSKTCKRFQQLCNTEEFWEEIKRLQDKHILDVKTTRFPAFKTTMNFRKRPGYLTQIQRRQTTFF